MRLHMSRLQFWNEYSWIEICDLSVCWKVYYFSLILTNSFAFQFEYSPESFLASIPEMRAFPKLSDLYATWKRVAEETGNVRIVTQRVVTRVKRSSGKTGSVKVWTRTTQGTNKDQDVIGAGEEEIGEEFDELILAVDADAALKILGDDASWMEAKVLGNVKVSLFFSSRPCSYC